MILPYSFRLLCLCFASFFVLNAAAALLVRFSASFAMRFAESRASGAAAHFLLALRILPFALAVLFVLALCVPSYLWLEPAATSEAVGLACVLLGLLGFLTCCLSIVRTSHSLFASMRHNRFCRLAGQETRLPGESFPVVLVENEAPLLALSGVLRPRLLVSRGILQSLSADELDAALRHERAHRTSLDNAKRLLILLAPDVLPFFTPLRSLDRAWSRFAEWAADDRAAAGDSNRAVSLAAALVRVARMGSGPRLPALSTSLLACDRDLSARVNRLLQGVPNAPAPAKPAHHRMRMAAFLLAGVLATLLVAPFALSSVHELLELLLH
jgi:beta-lactamase regulating signal transducer with metallopeptidase domain